MVRTIAITNQKGGVGKTTTAVNLTASLASVGRRMLLVDMDPQGNASMGCGVDKNSLASSVCDLMLGNRTFQEYLERIEEPAPGFDLLPANGDLTAAEVGLMHSPQRERRLAHLLSELGEDYEFIVIDCPPSLNMLTVNSLVAAQGVLIPIQCKYYALEGLSALLKIKTIPDPLESQWCTGNRRYPAYHARSAQQPGSPGIDPIDHPFQQSGLPYHHPAQRPTRRGPKPRPAGHAL